MQRNIKALKFIIIIPAFNEEKFIGPCLDSLLNQTYKPSQIIVVDDASTDATLQIINDYAKVSGHVKAMSSGASANHQPGGKVIDAFKKGLKEISLDDFDVICKFDADLEFPLNYLESLSSAFINNPNLGLYGGVCSVFKNRTWEMEDLTNADHVRGALKSYRIKAFYDIGGLDSQMGWDTADEFKLRYREWQVVVNSKLVVKHHKATAKAYHDKYFTKQGEVFYTLRYSILLAFIAALKIAYQRNQLLNFLLVLKAFSKAKTNQKKCLLTAEEGQFLRKYRWKQIWKKLTP